MRVFRSDIYLGSNPIKKLVSAADIILALTDNHLSRIECLRLALNGGAEFLQAGVDIRLDHNGKIVGLVSEVTSAEVGRFCPLCIDRLDPGLASIEARSYNAFVKQHAMSEGYIPDVPAPSVMSINSIAAGTLVLELQRRIAGLGARDVLQLDIQTAKLIAIDRVNHEIGYSECNVCGRGEGELTVE